MDQMRRGSFIPVAICICALARIATAATWYVATNGNDSADGTNWATARATIQAAIDVAVSNDTVLVSNGVYSTGGRVVYGAMTNRVAITNAVTVQSVNGPEVTVIEGARDPVTTNGDAAVRCIYVGTNAALLGFTLTNGATRSSGDYSQEESGGGTWCETSGTLSNCILSGNSAYYGGGGSWRGTLNHCTISGNNTMSGGGTCGGTLNHCTLAGNSAYVAGGGTYGGTLNHCTLTGNSAHNGGGTYGGTLNHCTLTGNSVHDGGGGAYGGALNNCTLRGNLACVYGGGTDGGVLNNCTLTDNSADQGGGAFQSTLNNCIVYYNSAAVGMNFSECTLNYCCTAPDPGGTGNITNEPKMASASHLSAASPCISRGSSAYVSGTDIDGETWLNPPSMGCDEVISGSVTGALSASAWARYTNVATGFPTPYWADISGRTTGSVWNFSDGTILSNCPFTTHKFSSTGAYDIILAAYNESYPLGVVVTVTVQVAAQTVHYVNIGNATSAAPYTSWATAATNVQDAVDVTWQGGALVLVSNGAYASGGRAADDTITNRVAITNCVIVQSVNGPAVTMIEGGGPIGDSAVRCAYVGKNAVLSGFTLTNGATRDISGNYGSERHGAGARSAMSAIVTNCILTGNSALIGGGSYGGTLNHCALIGNSGGGSYGGTLNHCTLIGNAGSGASDGTLNNCVLTGNSGYEGGGAHGGTLNNCTLTGNSATSPYSGGGSHGGTLHNCVLYFNIAPNGANYYTSSLSSCCTTPDPGGTGNITNQPHFVATNDFHLATDSPCIDQGNNACAPGTTDLDGNPRILNGIVDMGAYEFQYNAGYWLWASGVTNGLTNVDQCATGDGYPNLLKYATGSSPTIPDGLPRLACGSGSDWLSLYFNRNTNAADVTLIVEGADALTNGAVWNGIATNINGSWGGATNVAEVGTTNPLTVEVQDPAFAGTVTSRYLRLHVTRP